MGILSPAVTALRTATRRLRRDWAFSLVVISLLGVALAATTLATRLVWGIVYAPLPYSDPESLVFVSQEAPGSGMGLDEISLSEASFLHYRDGQTVFESFAGYYERGGVSLYGDVGPTRIATVRATLGLPHVLRVEPTLGRWFTREECAFAEPAVAVVSHALWQNELGGDPDILERRIRVDGVSTAIVGVMPQGFDFPIEGTRLWTPLAIDESAPNVGNHWVRVVARLAPGVTEAQAQAALTTLVPGLTEIFPEMYSPELLESWQFEVTVRGLLAATVRKIRPTLAILATGVGLVLAVCCANAALLFFVRGLWRGREIDLRRALGAGRRNLTVELLMEPMLLTAVACTLGWSLASVGARWVATLDLPIRLPRLQESLGAGNSWVFVGALFVLTAFAISVPAMIEPWKRPLLPSARAQAPRSHAFVQSSLICLQIALAVTLVFGASLMLRSSQRLRTTNLGFATGHVLSFGISLPPANYADEVSRRAFNSTLLSGLESLPGVRSVALSSDPPISESRNAMMFYVDDGGEELVGPVGVGLRTVSSTYFDAADVSLLRGRPFESRPADRPARNQAIIDRAFSNRFFADRDPIGHRLRTDDDEDWYEIVGEVPAAYEGDLGTEAAAIVYLPIGLSDRRLTFVVRSERLDEALPLVVRDLVRKLDPQLPLENLRTISESVRLAGWRIRLLERLLLLGALLALGISAAGIAAVISMSIRRRTFELAIRLALGADGVALRSLVLRPLLAIGIVGVTAGVVGGLLLGLRVESLVYDLQATDTVSLAAGAGLTLAAGLAASLLVTRQLSRMEPAEVLRKDSAF